MYIHLEFKPTGSTSTTDANQIFSAVWNTIKDTPTITTIAQFGAAVNSGNLIDTASSYIVGTKPTNGIYTAANNYTSGRYEFTKKHYDHASKTSTNTQEMKITVGWSSTTGFSMGVNDKYRQNPSSESDSYLTTLSSSIEVGDGNMYNARSIDLCITDCSFTFAAHGDPNNQQFQQPACFKHWGDYPTVSDYDDYHVDVNDRYYAGCMLSAGSYGIVSNGNSAITSAYSLYRFQMFDETQQYRNTVQTNGGYHVGWSSSNYTSQYQNYLFMTPMGRKAVRETPTNAGFASLLHPCYVTPTFQDWNYQTPQQNDTRYGQMLGIYRIADNMGTANQGNRLQVGSDYYRIIKGGMSGQQGADSGYRVCCYAVPESNITGP